MYSASTKFVLTAWNRVLLEGLIITKLVKFPDFYGTRRFTNVFTSTHHWSLSWARCIQSVPSHRFPRSHSNVILPYMPRSSAWSLPFRLSIQNIVCICHLFHACYMSHPSCTLLFDHLSNIGEVCKLRSSSYTFFSIMPPLPFSWVQIFSSAL